MSQLNLFMTEEESRDALQWILSTGEFKLYQGRSFISRNPISVTSQHQIRGNLDYTIWVHNEYSDPECSSSGSGDYLGHFLFDMYFDPVIYFESCIIDKNLISPGRLYYKAEWVKDPELRKLHKKQCERIVKYFKRNLVTLSAPFKITQGIQKLVLSGYVLELGGGGRRIAAPEMRVT